MIRAIGATTGPFRVADIRSQCLNVSVDMIRRVLKDLKADKRVRCLGRGQAAEWEKAGRWELGKAR